MTEINQLFKHSSHYLLGQILGVMASFISFPLFTRIFSTHEYGILHLVNITLVLAITFAKLGIQQSSVRFYEEFKMEKREGSIQQFYSTLFLTPILIGSFIGILFLLAPRIFLSTVIPKEISSLLIMTAILIPTQSGRSTFIEFLRAEKKTKFLNIFHIAYRYIAIVLSAAFALYVIRGLPGFFFGRIVTEVAFFLFILYFIIKRNVHFTDISKSFLSESVRFGFPLFAFEMCFCILDYSDRYLLQYFLGSKVLGIYSAGYNLASYLASILFLPVQYAAFPIYMSIWVNKGEAQTKEFLDRVVNHLLLVLIPSFFILCSIRRDLIVFLASDKFVQAHVILPFVFLGLAIFHMYNIFAAGLLIHKKLNMLPLLIMASALLNILLNLFLIPKYGIMAAAGTTLFSYIFLIITIARWSFKLLQVTFQYRSISRYLLSSLIAFFIIEKVAIPTLMIGLLAKVIVGLFIYVLLIIIFDKEIRQLVHSKFSKFAIYLKALLVL